MSLIIPAADWAAASGLLAFLDLLNFDRLPEDIDATRVSLKPEPPRPLPPAEDFNGNELLEALFLEDTRSIVMFDLVSPELVATRLLTALWPSLRQQFAVSTFALSPRKIDGRDFNLVFSPRDARSRFSEWDGRRIDGRSTPVARHRWTGTIVGRVFDDPFPELIPSGDRGIIVGSGESGDNAAALRIALLWDELIAKLDSTPTAALGLLDIANSERVRRDLALTALEPWVSNAVRRAPIVLPQEEAWNFLGAITRKLEGRSMLSSEEAVNSAVGLLAEQSPEGALAFLSQPDDRGVVASLLPRIADGIGGGPAGRTELALMSAPPVVLGNLVAESQRLAERIAKNPSLIDHFAKILPDLDASLVATVGQNLLPYLVMDWQLPAASPLLNLLDDRELAAEIHHLGAVNDFEARSIAELCIQRSRDIGARRMVLSALSSSQSSKRRDDLLAGALDASVVDAAWLLQESGLSDQAKDRLLIALLQRANDQQISTIISSREIGEKVLDIAESLAPHLLLRILFCDPIPIDVLIRISKIVFVNATPSDRVRIGKRALQWCLGRHFGGDEVAFIATMLGGIGKQLDGAWLARSGLATDIPASVASRNMVAFLCAPQEARAQIVLFIHHLAGSLSERRVFDLDAKAAEAFSQFLCEAEVVAPVAAMNAAGLILPRLMWQRNQPVSVIIAAAFPMVYRELVEKDGSGELLNFLFSWDRGKAARQDLVFAFMSSTWPPGDLALTACRCSDISRILRRTAKTSGGEAYLNRVATDLTRVPKKCRLSVERAIASIHSEWPSRHSWRE